MPTELLAWGLAGLMAMASAWAARSWAQPEVHHWLGPEAPRLFGAWLHLLLSVAFVALALTLTLGLGQQPLDTADSLMLGLWSGLLTACALTDLRCRLLPDRLTLSLAGLGLVLALLERGPGLWQGLAGALLGYGLPWLVGRLMQRRTNEGPQESIGRGDLALLGAMGLWVGFSGLPLVLVVGTLLMLPLVAWGMLRRGWTRATALPLGPSLCLAGVLVLPWVLTQPTAP